MGKHSSDKDRKKEKKAKKAKKKSKREKHDEQVAVTVPLATNLGGHNDVSDKAVAVASDWSWGQAFSAATQQMTRSLLVLRASIDLQYRI